MNNEEKGNSRKLENYRLRRRVKAQLAREDAEPVAVALQLEAKRRQELDMATRALANGTHLTPIEFSQLEAFFHQVVERERALFTLLRCKEVQLERQPRVRKLRLEGDTTLKLPKDSAFKSSGQLLRLCLLYWQKQHPQRQRHLQADLAKGFHKTIPQVSLWLKLSLPWLRKALQDLVESDVAFNRRLANVVASRDHRLRITEKRREAA
ncbi:hypothetical protein [Hymenobacter antarcticus]|uniref:Uncharacterized protein n=1 Tax=Hymenobacter antarcticus TaxID=486270 RepID=A0ABP7PQW2_9BACT